MNKVYLIIGIVVIFIVSFFGLSFNDKQPEYLIVDGVVITTINHPNSEGMYYYWDNNKRETVIINNRYKLLNIAANDGWKLQSTYAYINYSNIERRETFIFTK